MRNDVCCLRLSTRLEYEQHSMRLHYGIKQLAMPGALEVHSTNLAEAVSTRKHSFSGISEKKRSQQQRLSQTPGDF